MDEAAQEFVDLNQDGVESVHFLKPFCKRWRDGANAVKRCGYFNEKFPARVTSEGNFRTASRHRQPETP